MSYSWLAPPCFDEDLINKFFDTENWHWYLDIANRHEANRTAVLAGHYELLFADKMYHSQHYAYMWQKLHRGVLSGSVIDGFLGTYRHIEYCAESLVEEMKGWVAVQLVQKYPAYSPDGLRAGWYTVVDGNKVLGYS